VDSILRLTDYDRYEIVVVNNRSREAATRTYLATLARNPRVKVLEYDKVYSFAALNNWAVEQTDTDLVAFVNNDIEVTSSAWLSEMVACACREIVGAVGAKLLYPNGRIQHAGIVMGLGGLVGHLHAGAPGTTAGYFGRASCSQQFSAVTAACLVMRREVFQSLSGFDETHFNIAFNDVDLGLRLNRAGYRVVWLSHVELIHHESASLGDPQGAARKAVFDQECAHLRQLWSSAIEHDPFYNPNLTVEGGDSALAFPPRVQQPWRADMSEAWRFLSQSGRN
jgi:GT2 family glycosyltransferase